MATIASLVVAFGADLAGFRSGMREAVQDLDGFADRAEKTGRAMQDVGESLTKYVTLPLVAAAGASLKFSTDFNASMANVASLVPGQTRRVEELKASVQGLAVDVGRSTGDLAAGLYQTISAFGNTADTATILATNARAAVAGVATVTDAINLTSAVTKGYGDTTARAVEHVADLSLLAVRLGQTTFPELASSIGRVTPLAANMGVTAETLFGAFSTLAGVTGSAAEVGTQLRGVLSALANPSDTLRKLFAQLGVSSGEAAIAAFGLGGTLQRIVASAEASRAPLANYIGNIEAIPAALALAGPQAQQFASNVAQMNRAAGTMGQAFAEQTSGINAAGFALSQFRQQATVAAQRVGDALAPVLLELLNAVRPAVDAIVRLASRFDDLSPRVKTFVTTALALAAAIGPIVAIVGALTVAVGTFAASVAALSAAGLTIGGVVAAFAPVALVAVALVAVVAAVVTFRHEIARAFQAAWQAVRPFVDFMARAFAIGVLGPIVLVKEAVLLAVEALMRLGTDALASVRALANLAAPAVAVVADGFRRMRQAVADVVDFLAQTRIGQLVVQAFGAVTDYLRNLGADFLATGTGLINKLLKGIADGARDIPVLGPAIARYIESLYVGTAQQEAARRAGEQTGKAYNDALEAYAKAHPAKVAPPTAPKPVTTPTTVTAPGIVIVDAAAAQLARRQEQEAIQRSQAATNDLLERIQTVREQYASVEPTLTRLSEAQANVTDRTAALAPVIAQARERWAQLTAQIDKGGLSARRLAEAQKEANALATAVRTNTTQLAADDLRRIGQQVVEQFDLVRNTAGASMTGVVEQMYAFAQQLEQEVQKQATRDNAVPFDLANVNLDILRLSTDIRQKLDAFRASLGQLPTGAKELPAAPPVDLSSEGLRAAAALAKLRLQAVAYNTAEAQIAKTVDETAARMLALRNAVTNLGQTMRGVAATLASQGTGVLEALNPAKLLTDFTGTIANGITGLISGGITSLATGLLNSVVGGITGLFTKDAERRKEANEIVRRNTEELERQRLARTGFDPASAAGLKLAASAAEVLTSARTFEGITKKFSQGTTGTREIIEKDLAPLGVSLAQLDAIAESLGIQLYTAKGQIDPRVLAQFKTAIADATADLTRFRDTIDEQRQKQDLLNAVRDVDVTPVVEFNDSLAILRKFAPLLGQQFASLNDDSAASVAQAKATLKNIAEQFAAGLLTLDDLGAFDKQSFVDFLLSLDSSLDRLSKTTDDVNTSFRGMLNVPTVWKETIDAYRFAVAAAAGVPATSGAGVTPTTLSQAPDTRTLSTAQAPLYIDKVFVDARQLTKEEIFSAVKQESQRAALPQYGSKLEAWRTLSDPA